LRIRDDWKILAEKPLLSNFPFIMKPICDANHRWAMAKAEEGLGLARRRAERALISAPPAATWLPVGAPRVAVAWTVTPRRSA
jgi:hypothetical protein